jgi:hypothetical protein
MPRWPSLLGSVTALLLAATSNAAQLFDSKLVDPFDAKSPSGSFVLHVDPSERLGWGPAKYTLARNGEVLFTKELDCTIREVVVGEDGVCGGSAQRLAKTGGLELVLLLLGRDGTKLFEEVLPPEQGYMHGPNFPYAAGNILVADGDCVVFRVMHWDPNRGEHGGEAIEEWRVVRCSTGEKLSVTVPANHLAEPRGVHWFAATQPIRGAPLLAAQAMVRSSESGERGATIAVFDLQGKPVWERREAEDYLIAEDEEAEDQLWSWIREHGALFECETPGRFEFALARERKRVLCEVRPDPAHTGQWIVDEVGRKDYVIPFQPAEEPTEKEDPTFQLELLGTIELQAADSPVERIWKFDIDDRGRLGAMVIARDQLPRFVLRQPSGDLVADVALELGPSEEPPQPGLVWLKGDRWLVHTSEIRLDEDSRAHAWWLDLPGGALTEIQDFECAPIDKADGTFDGGFVALTSKMAEYTIIETLSSFDAEGHLRWEDVQAYGQSDDGLFSPEGLAFSPIGEVGVLDNIKKVIQRFDLAGKLTSEIDLAQAFGREPNYPDELGVDPNGNWVVYDSNDSPPVTRVTCDAQVTASFAPAYPDGRTIHAPDGLRVAPDGSLWASDSYALVRLDASGVVDRVLGEPPSEVDLGEVTDCFIDPTGRILMEDLRTHAVHVFDSRGQRLAICKLGTKGERGSGCLAVAPDQSIYVGGRKFAPNGVALGYGPLVGVNLFQPASGRRWAIDNEVLHLFESDGTQLKGISRSPDDRWLYTYGTTNCAVGADGTLVLSSRRRLHLFSADGEPLRTLEESPGGSWAKLALSKSYVFAVTPSAVWRTNLETGASAKSALEEVDDEGSTLTPAWREDLGELWLANPVAKKVERYRVKE